MFLSLSHDYRVDTFNSAERNRANPAVENKRSHMFDVGAIRSTCMLLSHPFRALEENLPSPQIV